MKKAFDKFLKTINSDINTFVGFILTLICIFLCIDRVFEIFLLMFIGIAANYWTIIHYVLAFTLIYVTYLIISESKFITHKLYKLNVFNFYAILFGIMIICMVSEFVNFGLWSMFFNTPNYIRVLNEDFNLIKAAFTTLGITIPALMVSRILVWVFDYVSKNPDFQLNIMEADGLKLGSKKSIPKAFTYYTRFGKDTQTGKEYGLSERGRFDHLMAVGHHGTGKTELVIEPMIARDIEKKRFFEDSSKELGSSLIKANIASLKAPHSNEYLNNNFNLDMLIAKDGKENTFKTYLDKLTLPSGDFKDLGVTAIFTDISSVNKLKKVAKSYHYDLKVVDPLDKDTYGLNPFAFKDAHTAASAISNLIFSLSKENPNQVDSQTYNFESTRAIENTALLLKETYPRKSEGILPNLVDLTKLLTNHDMIAVLLEDLKANESLAKKYAIQIKYFDNNFFSDPEKKSRVTGFIETPLALLENIIKNEELKKLLCSRNHNINFEEALTNGELILTCTRQGELPSGTFNTSKVLGNYILEMYKLAVQKRGRENSLIPNFFYIDDYAPYISEANMEMFRTFGKQKVGITITLDNLEQMDAKNLRNQMVEDINSKIVFGDLSMEEGKFWEGHFGVQKEWVGYKRSLDDSNIEAMQKEDPDGAEHAWQPVVKAGKMIGMKYTNCAYKMKNDGNRYDGGFGTIDPIDSKHFKEYQSKTYDFTDNKTANEARKSDNMKTFLSNLDHTRNTNNETIEGPIKYK